MKRLRPRRPSPALVIALFALFIALGGTGYAALHLPKNSVGSRQIKNNAVTSSKIKNNAVTGSKVKDHSLTGSDINLGRLGTVPSATNATNATNASHATTADTATNSGAVDGMNLTSFTYLAHNGDPQATVLNNFEGLTLKASCTAGANNGLTVTATSATSGANISWGGITRNAAAHNDAFTSITAGTAFTLMSPGGVVDTGNGATNIGFTIGSIVYSSGSARVTVDWSYLNNSQGHDCYWGGTVVGAPAGGSAPVVATSAPARRSGVSGSLAAAAR
jgi:hypothetical protein